MSEIVYIGATENGPYLEIKGTGKSGEKYRRRTNNEETIRAYISRNANRFVDGVIEAGDLILYTEDKKIVIEDFDGLEEYPVFYTLFRRITNAPIVFENLKRKERTNLFQALQLKLLYSNKAKLAALALTGTLLVAGVQHVIVTGSANFQARQDSIANASITMQAEKDNNSLDEPEFTLIYADSSSSLDENKTNYEEEDNILNFQSRLKETRELQSSYGAYDNSKIMVGARVNTDEVEKIIETSEGTIIRYVGKAYGIDPYLLVAKGLAESNLDHKACCPGGNLYNGYGVGAFQLEAPDGRIVKAWNYENGCEDFLSITMENAVDFLKNAQGAAMYLQNRINLYNGNIYLALQSYNYGEEMMRVVIHDYAKQIGITEKEVKNNFDDLGWLQIVEDIHNNPNNYYYRVFIDLDETDPQVIATAKANYVWKYKTYGNPHYIADVLSYYVGVQSKNKNVGGRSTVINLSTNEITYESIKTTLCPSLCVME